MLPPQHHVSPFCVLQAEKYNLALIAKILPAAPKRCDGLPKTSQTNCALTPLAVAQSFCPPAASHLRRRILRRSEPLKVITISPPVARQQHPASTMQAPVAAMALKADNTAAFAKSAASCLPSGWGHWGPKAYSQKFADVLVETDGKIPAQIVAGVSLPLRSANRWLMKLLLKASPMRSDTGIIDFMSRKAGLAGCPRDWRSGGYRFAALVPQV